MKSQLRKIASLFLCVCLLLSVTAVSVFAAEESKTITFDDKSKRTSYSTSQQVWAENGITVTNDKAASTSPVGDYGNPARFYQGSSLKIEYPGMTKMVFSIDTAKGNANDLVTAIGTTATAVADTTSKCTVTFADATDSFTIANLTKQMRIKSITVYYETAGG
ncbi:MAG: hypothetical protein J6L00_05475, partial [Clostridia bacterium]|nr:hypothetical protein [Clostridia bacterium]